MVAEPESGASRRLLLLTDLGLAGVIFLAPLFMGGRYEIGRLVYVFCVATAVTGWTLRQCILKDARWRWSGAEPLLLAGLLLLLVQLTPWPQAVLDVLSPAIGKLLPLWGDPEVAQAGLASWTRTTLTPQATRDGLVTFLAHGLLFLVVVQRLRDRRDVQRIFRWVALAAVVMAVLGLAQFLFGNGKFLWIYEHPSRDTSNAVKGTFQNQNHFAHFLILGLGPLLWWLHRLWSAEDQNPQSFTAGQVPRKQALVKVSLLIALGIVIAAILLTFSRGGILAGTVALAVGLGLMLRHGLPKLKVAMAMAGVAAVLAGALAIYGYEPLSQRLSTLASGRTLSEISRARMELWEAHLVAIPQFPWTGTGAGSHREVYRVYMDQPFDVEFTHGENGYLHVLLEMGYFGLALVVAGAGLICWWCCRVYLRSRDDRYGPAAAAVLAGWCASLVHSLGDFVWYIPACMSLSLILAACACRLYQLSRAHAAVPAAAPSTGLRLSRQAWLGVAVILLPATGAMLWDRVPPALAAPHWDAYFKLSQAEQKAQLDGQATSADEVAAMAGHLQQLLLRDPGNARAHLRLAALCLREFDLRQMQSDNPMPLSQIRDAALASQFTDREALQEWLSAVTGDGRLWLDRALWHTRRALQLCPLQGEGYVYLAELCFLEGKSGEVKRAFIDQALQVRPYSGTVLLAAGGEAVLAGDAEQALALWKQAFHRDPEQQGPIIEMLASQMPVREFLEHFEPDLAGQSKLYTYFHRLNLLPQALELGEHYASSLVAAAEPQDREQAALRWSQAALVYEFLDNTPQFVHCAQQAVRAAPDDFARRRVLAKALSKSGEHGPAIEQLQWCLARQPEDTALQQELQGLRRLQLTRQQVRSD